MFIEVHGVNAMNVGGRPVFGYKEITRPGSPWPVAVRRIMAPHGFGPPEIKVQVAFDEILAWFAKTW